LITRAERGAFVTALEKRLAEHRVFLVLLFGAFLLRLVWLLIAQPTPVSDWHAY
jgi:hypothetical protein